MPKPKILQEDQSYSFRSYFELPYEVDQVLAELGYGFVSEARSGGLAGWIRWLGL